MIKYQATSLRYYLLLTNKTLDKDIFKQKKKQNDEIPAKQREKLQET